MTQKFKTAEEFNALSEEEQQNIVQSIIEQGYSVDARDYIDFEAIYDLDKLLAVEHDRVEKLAYAIGDKIKATLEAAEDYDRYEDAEALNEFMSIAAYQCDMQYGGEYMSHEDGFWVPSTC